MPSKLRKVSHLCLNHFHRIFRLPGVLLLILAMAMAGSSAAEAGATGSDCLIEPEHDALIVKALDRLYRMQYGAADSLLATLPDIPARAYFRGLVLVNRFNDLGDTAALFRAEAGWEAATKDEHGASGLYVGLTELQLSYVAGITGRRLRAAKLGRQGVGKLRPFAGGAGKPGMAEADAALALYDYYKASLLKGVSWIPFVNADAAAPLRRLESAIPRSRYLREILQTTQVWLYYDQGRLDSGLALIDAFLARYPENRLYRQIQADFRFRKGDVEAARKIQEGLNREYAGLAKTYPMPAYLPLGYLSSVGNLAKIYAAQGKPQLRDGQLEIWRGADQKAVTDWLPASLKREVHSLQH